MRYLYIDTSSSYLYSAIVKDNELEAEIKKEFGTNLSAEALSQIVKMFDEKGLAAKDIDKIIVVNGPGSFTGIRIGITIAKMYAWSLNIPITTITSLEAMMLSNNAETYKVPMIDARRKYVFAAIYDKDNNVVLKPQHIKIEDLNKELEKLDDYVVITNNDLKEYDNKESYSPDLLKIVQTYKDKENMNVHGVNPDYLKLTEAEESRQK